MLKMTRDGTEPLNNPDPSNWVWQPASNLTVKNWKPQMTTAEREAKRLRNQAAIKREIELMDMALALMAYEVSTWGTRLAIVRAPSADDYNAAQGSNFNPQGWGK